MIKTAQIEGMKAFLLKNGIAVEIGEVVEIDRTVELSLEDLVPAEQETFVVDACGHIDRDCFNRHILRLPGPDNVNRRQMRHKAPKKKRGRR